jgi:hypothetical protein
MTGPVPDEIAKALAVEAKGDPVDYRVGWQRTANKRAAADGPPHFGPPVVKASRGGPQQSQCVRTKRVKGVALP